MAGSKGSKYYDIFLKYEVWLEDIDKNLIISQRSLELLKLIKETGSLKAAAEEFGISYRKAWGDLKEAEEKLGFVLLDKKRGGQFGGTSELTEDGLNLIKAFEELNEDFNESIKKVTKKFFHKINK
jgi:molybdate transport system regulatory protein